LILYYLRKLLREYQLKNKPVSENHKTGRKKTHNCKSVLTRDREKKFEFIVNTSGDLMSLVDSNYRYEAVNNAYGLAHGIKPKQFVGKTIDQVWGKKIFRSIIKPYFDQCFRGQEVHYQEWFDFGALGKKLFDVIYYPYPPASKNVTHAVVVSRDITRQFLFEEELRRKQKLESMGIAAGSIVHDFSNVLTMFIGNLSLLRQYLPTNPVKTMEILGRMEEIAARTSETIQNMLKFIKSGKPELTVLNIADLLSEECSFSLAGSSVEITGNFKDKPLLIKADKHQLSQVFNNLFTNALQAMNRQGKISINTHIKTVKRNDNIPLAPGKYINIIIRDSGPGIDKEHLPGIFDPFFSLKNKGHGLGLAICYSIIIKHNGYILASSGKSGAIFSIYLPAAD